MTSRHIAREAGAVEPVAWRCNWIVLGKVNWVQYHDDIDPLPETWDSRPQETLPLYSQATVDALRTQLEAAERGLAGYIDQHMRDSQELRRLCGERDAMKARAEAAETAVARLRNAMEFYADHADAARKQSAP